MHKYAGSAQVTVIHILFPRFFFWNEVRFSSCPLRCAPGQVVPLRAVPIRDPLPSKADLKAAPLARIMLSNIARVHRLLDPGRPAAGSPPSVITGCNGEARCKKSVGVSSISVVNDLLSDPCAYGQRKKSVDACLFAP